MTAPLRIGVIGAGSFAQRHLEAYAHQVGVAVVGIADVDQGRAEAVASQWGIDGTFTDGAELIAACRPDGVSVVTPGNRHRDPTLAALAAGCSVLLEKPIATTSADVAAIQAAAREGSAFVMPAHLLRFSAPHAELRARVGDGGLGRVLGISSVRDRGREHERLYRDAHPALLTSIHDIDLALWISGARATRVSAYECGGSPGGPPLLVWAQIEADDGSVWSLRGSWLLADGAPPADRIDVYGSQSVAALDLHGIGDEVLAEALDAEVAYFCGCLRSGAEPSVVTLAEAALGVRIAEAIIESAAAGGAPVEVAA